MKLKSLYFNATRLSVFIISCLLFACTNAPDKNITFSKTQNVVLEEMKSVPFIGVPIAIECYNNNVIINDAKADTLILNYDIDKGVIKDKYLPMGQGPLETIPPLSISIIEKKLFAYSPQMRSMYYINLENDNNNNSVIETKTLKAKDHVLDIVPADNNQYLTAGFIKDGRYALLDSLGNVIKYIGTYPSYMSGEENTPFNVKAIFHQAFLHLNYSKKKVVSYSRFVIDLIDIDSSIDITKRILLHNYNYTFSSGNVAFAASDKSDPMGATDVTTTDDNIYILYLDKKIDGQIPMPEIWVFDWSLNPVKKILLDKSISKITAFNDNVLVGLGTRENDGKMFKINMN